MWASLPYTSLHSWCVELLRRCRACAEADRARVQLRDAARKCALLVFVAAPALCVALAALFGVLLAALEGWGARECFYLVLADLTGTQVLW